MAYIPNRRSFLTRYITTSSSWYAKNSKNNNNIEMWAKTTTPIRGCCYLPLMSSFDYMNVRTQKTFRGRKDSQLFMSSSFKSSEESVNTKYDESLTTKTTSNKDGNGDKEITTTVVDTTTENKVPLYRSEGLFCVEKPLNWTSNDVVSYIRGILERDARVRGAKVFKMKKTRSRKQRKKNDQYMIRVGHGGTLDPLATGVLVIGCGKGTKELQTYLKGSKRYKAVGKFGFETTTLDMEGNVTRTASYEHITMDMIQKVMDEQFIGCIEQIPPIYSAIRQDGQKLYEKARQDGINADEAGLKPRPVTIHDLNLGCVDIPNFEIDVECGGGTYIRSLIRDIAYAVESVATTTLLQRTEHGPFKLEETLQREDWSADNIYKAIDHFNKKREEP